MNKKEIQELLGKVFTTRAAQGGDKEDEIIIFAPDHFDKTTDLHTVSEVVSTAMYESGLTHEFSYEIASRAADILAEAEDWDNEDALQEAIDSAIPIYTNELMSIYASNSWAVDEAAEELGNEGDSTRRAQQAWYMQIQSMGEAIKTGLQELIDEA